MIPDHLELTDWTSIRAGLLPCASCGIAVSTGVDEYEGDDVEVFSVFGALRSAHRNIPQLDFAVTRCSECRMIRQAASDMLTGHPGVRQRIGSHEIALHRLEAALDALDLLGVTDAARIDRLTRTGTDLVALMDALTVPGAIARWAAQPRAVSLDKAAATPASAKRWGHVTSEQRQELRNASAALFVRRVEKPVDVLCPSDDGSPSGCMLCGVGAVEALRENAAEVWTLMSADSVTIGGRPRAESLDGVVCPRCDLAIDQARGVGFSAMTLSVRSFLGVPPHIRSMEGIDGLIGWAALPGSAPNREPWDHIDLRDLREAANALIGRVA